ncbi:MAG: HAD family hydrolase [Chitinophagia bacterium]|jgi:beta-phosphoglucomutase|nr:HAD family hydrolase [Chitinophagia bacterium]
MVKAIVFDFDGVIVDSMDAHFRTWQRLAYFLGYELDPALKDQMRGKARPDSLQLVLEAGHIEASDDQKSFYAQMKDAWFKLEIEKMSRNDVLPGVISLLEELKNSDIKTAVASSSRNAGTILNQLKMEDYFDVIVDATRIVNGKPDPAVFIETLSLLDNKAQDTVVIEDGILGIVAAKKIGCYCIGVGPDKRLAEKADYHIEYLSNISLLEIQSLA